MKEWQKQDMFKIVSVLEYRIPYAYSSIIFYSMQRERYLDDVMLAVLNFRGLVI